MIEERFPLTESVRNSLDEVRTKLEPQGVTVQVREGNHPSLGLSAADYPTLSNVLDAAKISGLELRSAQLATVTQDGVYPEDFHSTSNFTTIVRIGEEWLDVEKIEMDVGINIYQDETGKTRARTRPMHWARVGEQFVIGYDGVRALVDADSDEEQDAFKFMSNDVSTERAKGRLIARCADAIRSSKAAGKKTLLVGGPAIIHTGCAEDLAALIMAGWIDILFAGNALAAHDLESSVYGTSLGVNIAEGRIEHHGHTHHLRTINRIRSLGSIANAVKSGYIPSGVMHACITKPIPFVLAGSIRDDGPLPDVITDNVKAQDAMRALVPGVGTALMVATTLHSVATGNMLPASVFTFCIDSDADSVIKLTDRGTQQAVGIVTDCEFFMKELRRQLGA